MITMAQIEIVMVAIVVSSACVLPGVFLVLRGMALMSDAISHASLLGIVLFFFVVQKLNSPLLILGASLAGIVTVLLTETLIQTRRIKEDAAIGLVFPLFFSIGVILITHYISGVHIDSDCVLFGEIAFAPFDRFQPFGYDFGPISLWVMGAIGLLNAVFVWCFYKELKLVTFDKGLAHALGFSPIFVHYALMGLTSVTAVGAFESVGSVLVVALMITPPATAFLLTTRLSHMIVLSLVLGVLASIGGYAMAYAMDVSIAGAMATVTGLLFLGALFFAPTTGIVSKVLLNKTQRLRFSAQMLMVQLLDHEGKDNEAEENTITNMVHHMGWEERFAKRTARWAVQKRYIVRKNNRLFLTSLGRETAKEVMLNRN